MRKIELMAVLATLTIATPAMAQGRGRGNGGVPPGQRPAAGMCRIWIDGVPPGQQPAPTDCATAAARVPVVAIVLQGAWAALIALTGKYDQILNYVVSIDVLFFGLTGASLLVFRMREKRAGGVEETDLVRVP